MDDKIAGAWPDVPRLCFADGGPPHLDACLNWALSLPGSGASSGAQLYIHGYRRAAEALFSHVDRCERMSPDYIVFPLVFLWRHHLELALKNVIASGRELQGENPTFPAHHRLRDLWNTAKAYVVVYGDPEAPELANVESNISEFERIDPAAIGFRYPRDRSGSSPALTNPPLTINLAGLQEGMVAISNFLDAVHECQKRALDAAAEAENWR